MTEQRQTASDAFRRGRKIDRNRVLFEERAALFRRHVQRRVSTAGLEEYGPERLSEAIDRLGDGGVQRTEEVFRASMPALELTAQAMAELTMNPMRRSRPQDNWDFAHIAVAPVYADAFVSADSWLLDRVAAAQQLPGHRRAEVLRSTTQLVDWIARPASR